MALIFASIPIVETGNGTFTEVDVVCGLRIISGSVDRSNLKHGSEPVGETYSMPWSYPDGDLGDLGGPTTIVLTMEALLPDGHSSTLQLVTSVNASTASGPTALADIETALHAMVADAALNIDTAGLVARRVRMISFTGEEAFHAQTVVVELLGRSAAELASGFADAMVSDVVLGRGLAVLDYIADDPRPRTARVVTETLPAGTNAWLSIQRVTKLADLELGAAIGIVGPAPEILPVFVIGPWAISTTKPIGDPADGPVSSHAGISLFTEVLTAADLNLDDSDIPTGWILVHDLHYTFRDGFLEVEADLALTTPLAPEFKLGGFGTLRGEVRLKPVRFEDEPFSESIFAAPIEAEVELEWDDDPGSDVEDFGPVDGWFEEIVAGAIRDSVEREVNSQIGAQVQPRLLGILRDLLDDQRPDGWFSDGEWGSFREQIVAKFFIRFLDGAFFGTRNIDGVNVVGGLELNALAGSYSDNLSLLDLGDSCPGLEVGAAFAGFTGFFALSRFRAVVRSDARCSGWHDRYLTHRKVLGSLATTHPTIAERVVRTAFLVGPVLASRSVPLGSDAIEAVLELAELVGAQASPELRRDLGLFADVVKAGDGCTLDELLAIGASVVPPSAPAESATSESDALRVRKQRAAHQKRRGEKAETDPS